MTSQQQVEVLRGVVASHKAAIRRHRDGLARAKAALVEMERECARRGIRLIVHERGEGKGDPWPKNPSSTSTR